MSASREQSPAAMAETKLRWRLRSGDAPGRLAAVTDLAETAGPRALEPLCQALKDSDLEVRTAAARELGRLRDRRAIEPLMEAFRTSVVGGKAARQASGVLWIGLAWLFGFAVLLAAMVLAPISYGAYYGGFMLLAAAILRYVGSRREQSRFQAAVSTALAEIAEHQAAPEIHTLVAEFRVLSADPFQQERGARQACREAANRIEAATARYRELPVVAETPGTAESQLPLPAGEGSPLRSSPPRV